MGRLSDLQAMNLSDNQLSGSIPTEVATLTQLTFLDVGKFDVLHIAVVLIFLDACNLTRHVC